MMLSLISIGFYYSFEERLLNKYSVPHPIQMVGIEGVFGIVLCAIAIPILSSIPCPFRESECVYDLNRQPYL